MTRQERAIWNATYAAAVVQFEQREKELCLGDGALTCDAVDVADRAVRRLRDWQTTGHPEAGKKVR